MIYTYKCIKCETESEQNVDKVMEVGDMITLPCEKCKRDEVHKKIWKSYTFVGKFGDYSNWRQ